jgi:type IV pilus assembly protein PilY1
MGKGGRGYYALDVTSTTATSEANAAAKVLWEFPRSISDSTARNAATLNTGFTYGKPIITKTAAAGWVVLVTSGYNNGADGSQTSLSGATGTADGGGDGYGHLYVINPKTGDLIKDIKTPTTCNTAVADNLANSKLYPCGLTHINGYVEDRDLNNTTTYVYGGDLYGNVWRFDLSANSTASWSATKLAVLRSGTAATDPVQPITSTPELAKIEVTQGNFYYYVYVGTGQYLDKNDLPCPPSPATCAWTPSTRVTQTQSMYGLIDPRPTTLGTPPILPDPLRGSLLTQTFTTSGTTKTSTKTAITLTGNSAKKGWVLDYTGGERIVTDPALAAGALVYTSNKPSTEACTAGGSSWIYAVDYLNGGQTDASWSGTFLGNVLASRPVLIQLPNGKIYALTRTSDGKTLSTEVPISVTADAGKRISWRELFDK